MLGFKTKTTADRIADLRTELEATRAALRDAETRQGAAVVDGDERALTAAVADLKRADDRAMQLRFAIQELERRQKTEGDNEEAERIREQNKAANAQRAKRIAAARAVDKALAALGKAYDTYAATEPGGTTEDQSRLARRADAALRAAALHAAQGVFSALGIRRVAVTHRRSLESQEADIIAELDE
ncbi:MAG: hypothetical protein NTY35_16785 [Planctomycetota bacterium]|nr:hypothetical protein [Planctomycetota bacterium]